MSWFFKAKNPGPEKQTRKSQTSSRYISSRASKRNSQPSLLPFSNNDSTIFSLNSSKSSSNKSFVSIVSVSPLESTPIRSPAQELDDIVYTPIPYPDSNPGGHKDNKDEKNLPQTSDKTLENRASFRKYFSSLTPMYGGNIRRLTMNDEKVLHWSGWLDYRLFVCSTLVGIGNLVFFPLYFIKNGAFHFVGAYIIMLFCVGYPMVLMEAGLGQFCSLGPGACWEFAVLFKGLGYLMIMYTVIQSLLSFSKMMPVLILQYNIMYIYPWEQPLNSETYNVTEGSFGLNQTKHPSLTDIPQMHEENYLTALKITIFYAINWVIVILLLIPNIRTRGYIMTRMFILFSLSACVICVRALALPGAVDGIKYSIFNSSEMTLMDYEIWLAAFTRCFFSLNLMPGFHMTIASYNHFNNQICDDVFFCILVDSFFSAVGVIMTFSFLGNLAETTTFKLEDMYKLSAEDVILVKMPYSLSLLKHGFVWVLFYFTMVNLIFQLQMSVTLEVTITGILDVLKMNKNRRKKVVLVVCGLFSIMFMWICTAYAKDVLKVLRSYTPIYFLTIIGMCFIGSVLYVLGVDRFLSMLECCVGWCATPILSNRWWKLWWKTCWKYIVPLVYVVTTTALIYRENIKKTEPLESWKLILGRSLWAFFALLVFGTMAYLIARGQGGFRTRLRDLTKPSILWGPSFPQNRYMMKVGEEDRRIELHDKQKKKTKITDFSQLSY